MGTKTPNYNLDKPTIGGDDDNWGDASPGDGLNGNFDLIDTQMKVNADAVTAAETLANEKLPKDGSEPMTGALTLVDADPTEDGDAARKKYVDDGLALKLAITDAVDTYRPKVMVIAESVNLDTLFNLGDSTATDYRIESGVTNGPPAITVGNGDYLTVFNTGAQRSMQVYYNTNATSISVHSRSYNSANSPAWTDWELVGPAAAADVPPFGIFTGAAATIRASGISCARTPGFVTGAYDLTFSPARANNNYSVQATVGALAASIPGTNDLRIWPTVISDTMSTTKTQVRFVSQAGAYVDPTRFYITVSA